MLLVRGQSLWIRSSQSSEPLLLCSVKLRFDQAWFESLLCHRWPSCPATQPQLSVVPGNLSSIFYLIHLLTCANGHHSVPAEVVGPPPAQCYGRGYERNVWFWQGFDDSTMTDLRQLGSLEDG